jgi:hypothetical protein
MTIPEIFAKHKLYLGRMISAHKRAPIGCKCVWNANVIVRSQGKVFYGDFNMTTEGKKLQKIAAEIGEPIYILYEHDARFGKENDSVEDLISRAVWSTDGINKL